MNRAPAPRHLMRALVAAGIVALCACAPDAPRTPDGETARAASARDTMQDRTRDTTQDRTRDTTHDVTRDTARDTTRDTAVADTATPRTPESDPWLLEGIPTFDDLVALRDGDWVIVLASVARDGAAARPTVTRAADPRLAAVQQRAWNRRVVPFVVPSEALPALAPGRTLLVLGPFARADAERRLVEVRAFASDARLVAGW